ncbi:mitochondrial nucleoid-associated protein 1 isoform 2-T2 [Chlamydotis macqueenii]
MAAVPELCPHCHRPFKRLRSHLPHCKAAPRPGPGSAPGPDPDRGLGPAARPQAGSRPQAGAAGKSSKQPPSPGAAPRKAAAAAAWKGKAAAAELGGGSGPGLRRQPDGRRAEQKVEPTVQDVARSLDLLPEEVKDVPEKLSNGVKIVIEKHRARVIREKSGSRSRGASAGGRSTDGSPVEGPDPGGAAGHADAAQARLRDGITVPQTADTETRSPEAVESAPVSSKGEEGGGVKATNTHLLQDPPRADCRSDPGDLIQQEAVDKTVTEEKQMYLGAGVEYKAPLSDLHTKNLHLSVIEGFGSHNEGTSKNYLTGIQELQESKKQMAVASEPILNARRDAELALDQLLLHTSKSRPICLSRGRGRSTPAGAVGLEWFPDLYPSYDGLSIFPGKSFRKDAGITLKIPKGHVSEGQQGPLCERRLLDVRLGELPAWLAACDLSPHGLLGGMQRAWSSYYDKYINVRRGGPAGISMLLAGYCLLCYGWNYQCIKCHRWRKYH